MIGNPWGALAFLALGAILAIHLFRHRFEPHRLAGLYLWGTPGRDPTAGRRLHRLERTLSLLLELLLAAALAVYLLDPRLRTGEREAEHLVVVLDGSASLSARPSGAGADTASRAREKVRSLVSRAGRGASVTLVESGAEPAMLAGPAAVGGEAEAALAKWVPRVRSHPLEPALELAVQLAGERGVVHVVTDRPPGAEPPGAGPPGAEEPAELARIHWHAVGTPAPNAAILACRRERTAAAGRDRIFVRVGAFGGGEGAPVKTVLRLASGAVVWGERALEIAPGAEARLVFEAGAGDLPVEASLSEDALEIDNRATLLRPPERPVRCGVFFLPKGPERSAVEAALRALPEARLVSESEGAARCHLVFAPLPARPSGLPAVWWCRIGPVRAEGEAPAEEGPRALLGPFLMEKGHPLLAEVHLGGVIWAPVRAGASDTEMHPLISAGGMVLAGLVPAGEGMDLALNLDLRRSSLQKTSDWPVLLANLLRLRQEALPGAGRANLRCGESLAVVLPREEGRTYRIEGPSPGGPSPVGSLSREIPGRGRVVLDGLETPGTWRIVEGERTFLSFATHFSDGAESDLSGAASLERAPERPGEAERRPVEALLDPWVHFPLLLLALGLFFANAFVAHRGGGWR